MWFIIILMAWIVCAIVTYGITFAFFQNEYPTISKECYQEDKKLAINISLGGPVALAVILVQCGVKHGFKFQ